MQRHHHPLIHQRLLYERNKSKAEKGPKTQQPHSMRGLGIHRSILKLNNSDTKVLRGLRVWEPPSARNTRLGSNMHHLPDTTYSSSAILHSTHPPGLEAQLCTVTSLIFQLTHHRHEAIDESHTRHRQDEQASFVPANVLGVRDGEEGRYGHDTANALPSRDAEHFDDSREHDKLYHGHNHAGRKKHLTRPPACRQGTPRNKRNGHSQQCALRIKSSCLSIDTQRIQCSVLTLSSKRDTSYKRCGHRRRDKERVHRKMSQGNWAMQ